MRTFYRLVILNLTVMSFLSIAVMLHALNKQPAMPIVVAMLLVANCLIIWKVFRQSEMSWLQGNGSVGQFKVAWIVGATWTIAVPLDIASCVKNPDFWSAAQVIVALWWTSYAWVWVRRSQQI